MFFEKDKDPDMKIAIMTNSMEARRGVSEKTALIDCMRRIATLGYRDLDLSLTRMMNPDSEFNGESWESLAHDVRNEADRLGVRFVQGHLPFRKKAYNYNDPEEAAFMQKATDRSIEIAGICGAQCMVVHPIRGAAFPAEAVEENIRENMRVYSHVLEVAHEKNIKLAFENLPDWPGMGRTFGGVASELIALIDAYNDPLVGACWDFGHANLNYSKDTQVYGIRKLGKRLIAVHVHDNKGKGDDHVVPFSGNIVWEDVIKAVKDTGFDGYWVPEVTLQNNMPDFLKDDAMKFVDLVARRMIEMYDRC